MLPTGELLVFSVTSADSHSNYRCRTVHHVTGDTVESSSQARLVVTGKFLSECIHVYRIFSSGIRRSEVLFMSRENRKLRTKGISELTAIRKEKTRLSE